MKGILNIAKYIVAVSAIAGAALFFDDFKDASRERDEAMLEAVEHINIEQQFMAEDIMGIKDTLEEFESEHRAQGEQIKSLAWGLKNVERFTPEDFEEIMNEMLNKRTVPSYSGSVEFIPID